MLTFQGTDLCLDKRKKAAEAAERVFRSALPSNYIINSIMIGGISPRDTASETAKDICFQVKSPSPPGFNYFLLLSSSFVPLLTRVEEDETELFFSADEMKLPSEILLFYDFAT